VKREIYITIPASGSLAQLATAICAGVESLSPADRAQWDASCAEWRQEQAQKDLLDLPLENDWVN
jgi:hypothetical protein